MRQAFICHYSDYNDVTEEELRYMLRNRYHRVSFRDLIQYYEIPFDEVINFLRARKMNLMYEERRSLNYMMKPKEVTKETNWYDVSTIPKSVVCAMYNVDFEVVKGNRAYDMEEYTRAVNDLQNKIDAYTREEVKEEDNSSIKPIDLIAMRYYRGVNRKNMAKKLGRTPKEIMDEERKSSVTKKTANEYMRILSVSDRKVRQLRRVMNGEVKRITEDRTIPKLIKLSVYIRDGGKCNRCKEKERLHYHHIKRFADGGENTKANLMLLCVSCHAEEHKGERGYELLKSQILKG